MISPLDGPGDLGTGGDAQLHECWRMWAIPVDATIVRAVLLPASMTLLGDKNWYLPRWLSWLPHLEHERAPETVTLPKGSVSA